MANGLVSLCGEGRERPLRPRARCLSPALLLVAVSSMACQPTETEAPDLVTLAIAPDGSIATHDQPVAIEDLAQRLDDLHTDRDTEFVVSPAMTTRIDHTIAVVRELIDLQVEEERVTVWDPEIDELLEVGQLVQERWQAAPEVRKRIAVIGRELQESDALPPWAGEYYYGDGLGTNSALHLAPNAGFAFVWSGCMGLYGQNLGGVRSEDSRVYLDCAMENDPGGFGDTRIDFIYVPWGERSYLIAPQQMIAFGNDIKAGIEPRRSEGGLYMMRIGDPGRGATGAPQVPAEFAPALEAPMIKARIVEILDTSPPVEQQRYGRAHVQLDLGLQRGAHREMRLVLDEPDLGFYSGATIQSLNERGSIAELLLSSDEPAPQVGWTFIRDPD